MIAHISVAAGGDDGVVVVFAPRHASQATQTQAQTQQPTETQIRQQIQQSAAEIRRSALENARAQIEAQRANLEAQRSQGSGIPTPPAPPGLPGTEPQVTITRDGKTVTIGRDGKTVTISPNGQGPVFTQTGDPGFIFRPMIPAGAVTISIAFFIMLAFIAVGLPLARAWARRMDRQSKGPAPFPLDVTDRLERIEHAVEAVAIEVERISEGQRFTTKLLTDRGESLPAAVPAARPDEFAGGAR